MRLQLPRALVAAGLTFLLAACAVGDPAPLAPPPGTEGGRFRVLVPAFSAEGVSQRDADVIARELRSRIDADMLTHRPVPESELRNIMRHQPADLPTETFIRQAAGRVNAPVIFFGNVRQAAGGVEVEGRLIDAGSGDELALGPVSGADPQSAGAALFATFQQTMEGIIAARACNQRLISQQYQEALEFCERAVRIVPESPAALYGLATAYLHLERHEEAYGLFQRQLEIDPEFGLEVDNEFRAGVGLLGAGFVASHLGRPDAVSYYRRYLGLNPDALDVRMRVAGEIAATGDHISAFEVLSPELDGEEAVGRIDVQQYGGQLATSAGQRAVERDGAAAGRPFFEAALRYYGRVMEVQGDDLDVDVLRSIAAVNLNLNRTAEAIRVAELATRRAPESSTVWAQYGDILRQANRHADAVQAYGRVISLNPDHEGIYVRRGMARLAAGQRQAGLADLEQAAQRGSRDQVAQVIFGLAANELRASNWAAAASLLQTAHGYASGAQRNQIAFQWGVALYRQGEAIARANTRDDPAQARRALDFFRQAIPRLNESGDAQAPAIAAAAQQYIANQEAIIRRSR
jgi:tetratricopeptide (TPR) repeat protein